MGQSSYLPLSALSPVSRAVFRFLFSEHRRRTLEQPHQQTGQHQHQQHPLERGRQQFAVLPREAHCGGGRGNALAAHDADADGLVMVRHFEVVDASIRQKKPL